MVWAHFKSLGCAAISFLCGVFIDADHFFDYYSNHRTITFKIKDIYNAFSEMRLTKIYILLHSYELAISLWAAIYIYSLPDLWKAAAIGLTQHLLFDQITNPLNGFGYFIIYRIMKAFRKDLLINRI